ncbi:DUF6093 family protein [Microbacterium maritypicum]
MSVVDELLADGRRVAQSLMDSTVVIRRETGTTRDSEKGKVVPTLEVIYRGPARVRLTNADPREVDASGQRFSIQDPTISLPIGDDPRIEVGSSAAVRVDDVGEVVATPHDTGEVGTTFRVYGRTGQTHSTARRLKVEVLSHG